MNRISEGGYHEQYNDVNHEQYNDVNHEQALDILQHRLERRMTTR